ncbi:hypothetical protein E3N88_30788 [Mikania micrantha]|uniref:Uncharacterized protein n=1 Tax=Mikania micrantha TaxID=192012 RepID=A0A5N6MQM1_9ASTR|nr:hypothetical protein E3N88_30788 [Mikania micrantha]
MRRWRWASFVKATAVATSGGGGVTSGGCLRRWRIHDRLLEAVDSRSRRRSAVEMVAVDDRWRWGRRSAVEMETIDNGAGGEKRRGRRFSKKRVQTKEVSQTFADDF